MGGLPLGRLSIQVYACLLVAEAMSRVGQFALGAALSGAAGAFMLKYSRRGFKAVGGPPCMLSHALVKSWMDSFMLLVIATDS